MIPLPRFVKPAPTVWSRRVFLFTFSVLSLAVGAARADVVYNSFGPANAIDQSQPPRFISGGAENLLAVRFVPSAPYALTQVSAYLRSTGGNGQSSIFARVVPDSGGVPAAAAAAVWTSTPQIVSMAGGTYTFTSPTSATISAGQPYWLVLDGTISFGNAAISFPGSPHVAGTHAETFSGSSWMVFNTPAAPAVRVEGALSGACCNRATGGCVVLQASACATLGLRFDGNGSTCSPATCRPCPGDFNRSGAVSTQDLFDFLAAYFTPCL